MRVSKGDVQGDERGEGSAASNCVAEHEGMTLSSTTFLDYFSLAFQSEPDVGFRMAKRKAGKVMSMHCASFNTTCDDFRMA